MTSIAVIFQNFVDFYCFCLRMTKDFVFLWIFLVPSLHFELQLRRFYGQITSGPFLFNCSPIGYYSNLVEWIILTICLSEVCLSSLLSKSRSLNIRTKSPVFLKLSVIQILSVEQPKHVFTFHFSLMEAFKMSST